MHLSPLSDGFVSDSLGDSAAPIALPDGADIGASHALGLVRGLVFVAALACPVALAAIPSWLHHRAADASFAEFTGHVGEHVGRTP